MILHVLLFHKPDNQNEVWAVFSSEAEAYQARYWLNQLPVSENAYWWLDSAELR